MTTFDPQNLWNVPSITKQGWEAGFFDFGKAQIPNVDYFNCGLVQRDDGMWLVTRRARWDVKDKLGHNDVCAFSMQPDTLKLHAGFPVGLGKQWPNDHFEDPRACFVNGRTYISACNFVRDNTGCTFPHQVICEVDKDWQLVQRFDPVYGHNGSDTAKNTKHEKNWTWFWTGNKPHLLYRVAPLTIVKMTLPQDPKFTCSFFNDWDASVWPYGEIRGGTPPVLVEGRYYVFFHSSTKWLHGKNQYHMGAFSFDSAAPFEPRAVTIHPLLSGSQKDPWAMGKPACWFPSGSLLTGDEWLITGGVNDLRCGWVKISHSKLNDMMICL